MFTLYSRFLYESDLSQLNVGWTGQAVPDSAVTLKCWSRINTQLKLPFLVISCVFLAFLLMLINLLCHEDTAKEMPLVAFMAKSGHGDVKALQLVDIRSGDVSDRLTCEDCPAYLVMIS